MYVVLYLMIGLTISNFSSTESFFSAYTDNIKTDVLGEIDLLLNDNDVGKSSIGPKNNLILTGRPVSNKHSKMETKKDYWKDDIIIPAPKRKLLTSSEKSKNHILINIQLKMHVIYLAVDSHKMIYTYINNLQAMDFLLTISLGPILEML